MADSIPLGDMPRNTEASSQSSTHHSGEHLEDEIALGKNSDVAP